MSLVLIVEDDAQILVFAESIIQEDGHETISASNYDGAIALFDEGHKPNLAIIDYNLGDGPNGVEVAKEARRRFPTIAVIYASGALVDDGLRAQFVEGCEFLAKPYTPEALREAIARLLS